MNVFVCVCACLFVVSCFRWSRCALSVVTARGEERMDLLVHVLLVGPTVFPHVGTLVVNIVFAVCFVASFEFE